MVTLRRDRRRKRGSPWLRQYVLMVYIMEHNAPYSQLHIYPRGCNQVIFLGFVLRSDGDSDKCLIKVTLK